MDELAKLARDMNAAPTENSRLELAVQAALELVGGCDHAGTTIVEAGVSITRTGSDEVAMQADRLQQELEEGPVVDTVRDHETVLSLDLATDRRWPNWAPLAHREVGVTSILSLLLYSDERSYGALSLYGDRPRAFDRDDLALAASLAGHVAVSIAAGRKIDHLGIALGSRTIIGQAEGILMERMGIDGDQAFAYLRRCSQDLNRKLVQLAAEIVATRELPDLDRPG